MDQQYMIDKLDEILRTSRHLEAKIRFLIDGTFDDDESANLKMILEQIKLDCELLLSAK